MRSVIWTALLACAGACVRAETPSAAVSAYIEYPATQTTVLAHVRVIDGTGAPALQDQTITIANGKIAAVEAATAARPPTGARVINLEGRTVIPGIVGMHDHMYYIARPDLDAEGASKAPLLVPQMTFSSPLLYLGAGVTTMRTTGSVETYTDLNVKREIDAGRLAGPHMDVTGPYLEGANSPFIQMHPLRDADDARATVDFWAEEGVTSFKAYMNITRAELKAAIDEAHKLGLKITGHLYSVTYPEAAELGIDNLEHGFFVNTQLDPGKVPDVCPVSDGVPTLAKMDPDSPEAAALIRTLVAHHVALTSTLPVFEAFMDPRHLPLRSEVLDTMAPLSREAYLYTRNLELTRGAKIESDRKLLFQHGMALERKFVAAGGLLLAGPDPTGDGGVLPGFGDQREIELLVDAGFSPVDSVRIATLNGATYLGRAASVGSISAGKNADLVIVKGDPSTHIADIEHTEIVFKDGDGYSSEKLLGAARGRYGQY